MFKSKSLFLIAILACIVSSVGAQTTSPYSRYGYGILKDQAVGPSKGMGGIGYGLRNNQSANPMNPASYSRVDSLTFLFDIGLSVQRSKLSDLTSSQSDYNGGLDYITILVPLKKGLGLSFGVLPFSSVGYQFGSTEKNDGITYVKSFSGSGGFSQVYAGLGYLTPLKGLSVGANASYLFGSIDQSRSLPALGVEGGSNKSLENTTLDVRTFKFDLGAQYELSLSDNQKVVVGAVYSPKINSKASFEKYHYNLSESGTPSSVDTTSFTGLNANLPSSFGLGFTYTRNSKLTLGADVTMQKWTGVKYASQMGDELSQSQRFNDRWKYSFGAEYMIDPYDRSFIKKMKFRGGFNFANSYMNVHTQDKQIKGYNEYGATLGFGLPIKDNIGGRVSYVNINFEYKKLKPKVSSMISEEYLGVSVSVNINELWFFKNKIR